MTNRLSLFLNLFFHARSIFMYTKQINSEFQKKVKKVKNPKEQENIWKKNE